MTSQASSIDQHEPIARIYLYPVVNPDLVESQNPYVKELGDSLSKDSVIVNDELNKIGVLDLFRFLFKANLYLFNWIEDLPNYRYGKIQVVFFVLFTLINKLLGNKVIWMLHNKYTHDRSNNFWTNFMFKWMMKHSDVIITHSSAGLDFAREKYPKYAHKVKFIMHPVKESLPAINSQKEYDILFWGTIWPYKGLVKFLEYVKSSGNSDKFKILIAGRCFDDEYRTQLERYLSSKVVFKEGFYDFSELSALASKSRFIIFTHSSSSVLSSGALMDSVRMGARIIGPNHGAFKDLKFLNFISLYDSYDDIIELLSQTEQEDLDFNKEFDGFYHENNWESFGNKMKVLLNGPMSELL